MTTKSPIPKILVHRYGQQGRLSPGIYPLPHDFHHFPHEIHWPVVSFSTEPWSLAGKLRQKGYFSQCLSRARASPTSRVR